MALAGKSSGMTLIEILVGLLLSTIVIFVFRVAYKSLVRGGQDVDRTTAIQREVKGMTRDLEIDLRRAGFGLSGMDIFATMNPSQVRFLFKDLVGADCAANDTATVTYTADGHSLIKDLACAGKSRPRKVVDISPDSLTLALSYLDGTGAVTGASANVKTVSFSVEILSNPNLKNFKKARASQGSIAIVNNQ